MRLDEVRAFVPDGLSPAARAVYEAEIAAAWETYRRLTDILREDTLRIMGELRHLSPNASEKRRKKVAREAEKKAIETARYVIPVAAFTSMVHTVSGIVLHRLNRMMRTGDTPARERGDRHRDGGRGARPSIPTSSNAWAKGRSPRSRSSSRACAVAARRRCRGRASSIARLGSRISLLVDYTARGPETTADAVRAVLGREPRGALSDAEALELRLEPVAEPLPARDLEPRRALAADPRPAPLDLHVPEEALAHRGQPGPAPPHGPGLAAAPDPHRHAGGPTT